MIASTRRPPPPSCTQCSFMQRSDPQATCATHGGKLEAAVSAKMDDIKRWTNERLVGVRYCIVVRDTFDNENYPVYAVDDEEFWKLYDKFDGPNMQKVDEVYDLKEGDREHWYTDQSRRFREMPKRPTPTDVEVAAEG